VGLTAEGDLTTMATDPKRRQPKTYYPMYCKWCKDKGILRLVGYSEIEHSDGMCENARIWLGKNSGERKSGRTKKGLPF